MPDESLRVLEQSIDRLIDRCQTLEAENQRLKEKDAVMKTERAQLRQQHDNTRSKVEAMITRLKAMEQS